MTKNSKESIMELITAYERKIFLKLPNWNKSKGLGYYRIVSLVSDGNDFGVRECSYGECPIGVSAPLSFVETDLLERNIDPDDFYACFDDVVPVVIRGEAWIEAGVNITKGQYITASTIGTALPCISPYVQNEKWPCIGIALEDARALDLVRVSVFPMLFLRNKQS